jgi:hypothetical protein
MPHHVIQFRQEGELATPHGAHNTTRLIDVDDRLISLSIDNNFDIVIDNSFDTISAVMSFISGSLFRIC